MNGSSYVKFGYFIKPFDMAEFVLRVNEVLGTDRVNKDAPFIATELHFKLKKAVDYIHQHYFEPMCL